MYVLENNLARRTTDINVYHGMATSDRHYGAAVCDSDIQVARMLIEEVVVAAADMVASTRVQQPLSICLGAGA